MQRLQKLINPHARTLDFGGSLTSVSIFSPSRQLHVEVSLKDHCILEQLTSVSSCSGDILDYRFLPFEHALPHEYVTGLGRFTKYAGNSLWVHTGRAQCSQIMHSLSNHMVQQ